MPSPSEPEYTPSSKKRSWVSRGVLEALWGFLSGRLNGYMTKITVPVSGVKRISWETEVIERKSKVINSEQPVAARASPVHSLAWGAATRECL